MYIRIQRDRTVLVTVPLHADEPIIQKFISAHKEWILKSLRLVKTVKKHLYKEGESHYLLGKERILHISTGKINQCILKNEEIYMTIRNESVDREKLFLQFAKEMLKKYLDYYISKWSSSMGVSYPSYSIRRTRSRWGSCNVHAKRLSFSLELISKPPICIELVVVHELNHLLEPSHNDRFHRLMKERLPDYKERQMILTRSEREFN